MLTSDASLFTRSSHHIVLMLLHGQRANINFSDVAKQSTAGHPGCYWYSLTRGSTYELLHSRKSKRPPSMLASILRLTMQEQTQELTRTQSTRTRKNCLKKCNESHILSRTQEHIKNSSSTVLSRTYCNKQKCKRSA